MGWSVAHMFLCGIISAIMTLSGFGADTWQWWVVCLAQASSYIFGRAFEDSMR